MSSLIFLNEPWQKLKPVWDMYIPKIMNFCVCLSVYLVFHFEKLAITIDLNSLYNFVWCWECPRAVYVIVC